ISAFYRHSSYLFSYTASAFTGIYTLSLHDALPILASGCFCPVGWTLMLYASRPKVCPWSRLWLRQIRLSPSAATAPCSMGRLLRSEEHTSELQSRFDLVCRLLLDKKKNTLGISQFD